MAKKLSDIDLFQAYTKWYQGCGPFRAYYRPTNFVSLKHYPDFELNNVSYEADHVYTLVSKILSKYDRNTFAIIDIPGANAIKTAFHLQEMDDVKCIFAFTNPLHPNGLVGNKKYISALIHFGASLKTISPQSYAIILDQDRYGDYTDEELRMHFNNQYELSIEAFPPSWYLRTLNIDKVIHIYSGEFKEDVERYLNYTKDEGLQIYQQLIWV